MKKIKETKKAQEFRNPEIRAEFQGHLLKLAVCVFFFFLLADFKWVAIPFFLVALYQLLALLAGSLYYFDEYFPPKLIIETKSSQLNNFIYYFSALFFMFGLLLIIFEGKKIDNSINGLQLFWIGGLIGAVIAFVVTKILKIVNPSVYYESQRRATVYAGLYLGFFLIVPCSLSFINRHYASSELNCKRIAIDSKGKSSSYKQRTPEYFIFVKPDGKSEERFSIPKQIFDQLREGGKVDICTREGKLGYELVTEFRAPVNRGF